MKKLLVNFASIAFVLGVAVSLSSCHRGGDEEGSVTPSKPSTQKDVVVTANKTLVVALNQIPSGLTVTYAGKTVTPSSDKKYTFSNTTDGTLKVTVPEGYVPVSDVNVAFGENTSLVINVMVTKMSTSVDETTAQTSGVNNSSSGDTNAAETGVEASMDIPGTVTYTKPLVAKKYSVTVYTVPVDNIEDPAAGESGKVSPFEVLCEPDGAAFPEDEPAIIKLKVAGASSVGKNALSMMNDAGEQLTILDVDANNTISAEVPHFSVQKLFVEYTCLSIQTTTVDIELANNKLVAGENKISYKETTGMETNAVDLGLKIAAALGYGEKTIVDKTWTVTATGEGTVALKQEVTTRTFKAGNYNFTVTTYGKVTADITYIAPEPIVPSHIGGSN